MIEHLKIILVCVVAAITYGIRCDQVMARVCVEYFTVFHPPVFATQSLTLLAFGWGVIATWWVALFLGLFLALAARAGPCPKLSGREMFHPIARLLPVMACCALVAGITGFFLANHRLLPEPEWMSPVLTTSNYPRFMADWFAHGASYASGSLGGAVLCMRQYRRPALRTP